eukprot:gene12108-13359_t
MSGLRHGINSFTVRLVKPIGSTQNIIEGVKIDGGKEIDDADNIIERTSVEELLSLGNARKTKNNKLDQVISILKALQLQVDKLQQSVDKLKEEKTVGKETIIEAPKKCKCEEKKRLAGFEFEVEKCGNKSHIQGGLFLVDATYGTWDEHGFCQIFSKQRLPITNYLVTAMMYNINGFHGRQYGFPGIAFNIENSHNYDFVYIRLHRRSSCYQTGYVQNDKTQWIGAKTGACPDGPPKGRTWFKLEVFVRDNEAQLFLDGIQFLVFEPHFPPIGRGGVIVAAGQKNVIRFKEFNVTKIQPYPFSFYTCNSYHQLSEKYYRLDSEYGSWPDSGFCKAISKDSVNSENYAITAGLFNQRGSSGTPQSGVLGLMFNAQDQYNFDFVYFKPLSLGGCYTTGFVQNTNINWVNSKIGSCPGGPFKGAAWNNVTVYVREDDVTITLDGKHLVSTKAHFPSRSVGGIIVGNGIHNVASFKNYNVRPIRASEFDFFDCTSSTRHTQLYHILDAKHGSWPRDTFCRALSKKVVPGNYYLVSANMFIQGWRSSADAHSYVGLMYNAKDASNYDFVYLRPSKTGFCYKTGYVMNGAIQFASIRNGRCTGGAPKNGVWFKLTVEIRDTNAVISLDGKHLISLRPHFHVFSRGGVIVANGDRNVLTFRDFVSHAIKPYKFEFSSCAKGTHRSNGSMILDAGLRKWPEHGFCTALALKSLDDKGSSDYVMQVKLHNIDSWQGSDWGNVGLLFNALDSNNFEYVYIRLHNKQDCYQFGSVFNGVIRERPNYSGPCSGFTYKQGRWFIMRLKVTADNVVHLKIDHKNIATYNSTMPWHGRGGVLVANGFGNVLMFREFRLHAVE